MITSIANTVATGLELSRRESMAIRHRRNTSSMGLAQSFDLLELVDRSFDRFVATRERQFGAPHLEIASNAHREWLMAAALLRVPQSVLEPVAPALAMRGGERFREADRCGQAFAEHLALAPAVAVCAAKPADDESPLRAPGRNFADFILTSISPADCVGFSAPCDLAA